MLESDVICGVTCRSSLISTRTGCVCVVDVPGVVKVVIVINLIALSDLRFFFVHRGDPRRGEHAQLIVAFCQLQSGREVSDVVQSSEVETRGHDVLSGRML